MKNKIVVCHQPTPGEHFDREEIDAGQHRHMRLNKFLPSKAPAARGHGERNCARGCILGHTRGAQVAEVGRHNSGAVEPISKHGPKFRAPYSGYSPTCTRVDSLREST